MNPIPLHGLRPIGMLVILGGATCAAVACSSTTTQTPTADAGSDAASDGSAPQDAGPTIIDAASFASTCTRDDECVAVVTGDVCTFCNGCYTNEAISASELKRFNDEVAELKKNCAGRPPVSCTADCPQRRAICESGKCVHDMCAGGQGCTPRDAGAD